ncbi:hypothetical protein [Blastococcus brunescens]|uniref:Uncharacterized protein n=1 Tax=Blastococcus brunescens TaxID=1564165 RepID=A0ABZ1AUB2_9ACTN|nr:hypothetical protein [Blastococcus sp. BMG 8361]WRL61727.1 hypothetical protein U6N30_16450 [Blastococcus sp. BMG 8361]
MRIDGTVHRTEVTGTLGDVLDGTPLGWRVCDGPVDLTAGEHRVVAEPTPQFRPLSLTWSPTASPPQRRGTPRRPTSRSCRGRTAGGSSRWTPRPRPSCASRRT